MELSNKYGVVIDVAQPLTTFPSAYSGSDKHKYTRAFFCAPLLPFKFIGLASDNLGTA